MLAILTELKQICNFDRESDQSSKLDALHTLLDTIQSSDGKVLVFSQYVNTLDWLSGRIRIRHEVLHGGLSQEERFRILASFRSEPGPRALLVSLRAGGVGLNLQEASTVILFDRWWNPAIEMQAIHRAHRFGRSTPLEVIRFVIEDSIEARIAELLETKEELFREYISDTPLESFNVVSEEHLRKILNV